MRTLLLLCAVSGMVGFLTSCATRTIVIDSQKDVVRIGPDVKGTVYFYKNGEWVKTGNVHIPEGWYAGPMTGTNN